MRQEASTVARGVPATKVTLALMICDSGVGKKVKLMRPPAMSPTATSAAPRRGDGGEAVADGDNGEGPEEPVAQVRRSRDPAGRGRSWA
jgi:hypothetical protein